MSNFEERRRQPFITPRYYGEMEPLLRSESEYWATNVSEGDTPEEQRALALQSHATDAYRLLVLHYTAGEPVEPMRSELEKVIEAHERWQEAKRAFNEDPEEPALYFAEIDQYERCMQLIGLSYLLHRRDLLPRIAAMQDAIYSATDTLYEDLLAYELENRHDVDEWYHDSPYRDLINSFYRGDAREESLADLRKYLKAWYPAMKKAPWHDGHLRMTDTDGDYFGYWAFEAGAVAYLLDLDDSSIDHMVYPKDLVKFAREFEHHQAGSPAQPQTERLRCEAGQPCPREGWWFTPAKAGSRRRFQQGEVMPVFNTDYGATIWQWHEQQDR